MRTASAWAAVCSRSMSVPRMRVQAKIETVGPKPSAALELLCVKAVRSDLPQSSHRPSLLRSDRRTASCLAVDLSRDRRLKSCPRIGCVAGQRFLGQSFFLHFFGVKISRKGFRRAFSRSITHITGQQSTQHNHVDRLFSPCLIGRLPKQEKRRVCYRFGWIQGAALINETCLVISA